MEATTAAKIEPATSVADILSTTEDQNLRKVPPMKVAQLKRSMDWAEERMIKLQTELVEYRAIVRRKFTETRDKNNKLVLRTKLTPEHVFGFKLKRTQTETDLAKAKGDYAKTHKEYRLAVANNLQIERGSRDMVLEENRVRRESKKLLNQTKEILRQHGSNGGAREFQILQTIAKTADVKAFRVTFDNVMQQFDPTHHTMISGVSQVKTEIIHAIMELLSEETGINQPTETK